jgi:ParB family chromosome partitioning protein
MSDEGKKRNLGRGLSALFGEEAEHAPLGAPPHPRAVATELLHPSRFQPRRHFAEEALEALVESVRAQGILQPLLVRRSKTAPNGYEILAGERRWRAAQKAQLHEVPVLVRELSDREALEVALVENVQREDLSALEEAEGYQRLIAEFGHTQEALAAALGKSRSHVANTLRLLTLPPDVRRMLEEGQLTAGHARALIAARHPLEIAHEIIRDGLSVRQTEDRVRADHAPAPGGKPAKTRPGKSADILALERELGSLYGLKVTITADPAGAAGTLSFHYKNLDQIDEVVKRLRQR